VDELRLVACPHAGVYHTEPSDGCLHRLTVGCQQHATINIDHSCTRRCKLPSYTCSHHRVICTLWRTFTCRQQCVFHIVSASLQFSAIRKPQCIYKLLKRCTGQIPQARLRQDLAAKVTLLEFSTQICI